MWEMPIAPSQSCAAVLTYNLAPSTFQVAGSPLQRTVPSGANSMVWPSGPPYRPSNRGRSCSSCGSGKKCRRSLLPERPRFCAISDKVRRTRLKAAVAPDHSRPPRRPAGGAISSRSGRRGAVTVVGRRRLAAGWRWWVLGRGRGQCEGERFAVGAGSQRLIFRDVLAERERDDVVADGRGVGEQGERRSADRGVGAGVCARLQRLVEGE